GIQLAIIAILGVGATRVAAGEIGVSTLVAFLLYAFTLLTPVMELAQSMTTLQAGIAAAKRIREVESIPLEPQSDDQGVTASPNDRDPVTTRQEARLDLEGVSARYAPGAEAALNDVDITIPHRGHTASVGPSGAGKTTMFSLFLRFLEPEKCTLRLN